MQYKKKIFIVAGEVSGDQLGSILLRKLKNSDINQKRFQILQNLMRC